MAEWDEQRAAEIDWERFRTEKLYRALQTERGLPGRLPAGYQIDIDRFRSDASYRLMIDTRGVTLTPQHAAELQRMAEENRRRWGLPTDSSSPPPNVVCIDDPRLRIRRPAPRALAR